jgi:hypothetical protein
LKDMVNTDEKPKKESSWGRKFYWFC